MEGGGFQADAGQFGIADLDARRIAAGIQFGADRQAAEVVVLPIKLTMTS